ncbi:hypothetical protein DLAC_09349 [Tieghemostelium lacteum]|uniref:Mediator of DNA damage checkpoint protein 1 n=1 Tax=Tieghemostelium lacteum TaxID=361077 RepID=A0A151ZA17_TIELA|nr:hypothetical protein DLAC_09349 [Tieghemostelium lacteum]|eukprot:KYQ90714.1 hypothetical protein DLAC_09349 [Tieghemostelium lacteum]
MSSTVIAFQPVLKVKLTSDPIRPHAEFKIKMGKTSVGRAPSNSIYLKGESSVSSYHAQFEFDGKNIELEDLSSLNKTLIQFKQGDKEVQCKPNEKYKLMSGSKISFGSVSCQIQFISIIDSPKQSSAPLPLQTHLSPTSNPPLEQSDDQPIDSNSDPQISTTTTNNNNNKMERDDDENELPQIDELINNTLNKNKRKLEDDDKEQDQEEEEEQEIKITKKKLKLDTLEDQYSPSPKKSQTKSQPKSQKHSIEEVNEDVNMINEPVDEDIQPPIEDKNTSFNNNNNTDFEMKYSDNDNVVLNTSKDDNIRKSVASDQDILLSIKSNSSMGSISAAQPIQLSEDIHNVQPSIKPSLEPNLQSPLRNPKKHEKEEDDTLQKDDDDDETLHKEDDDVLQPLSSIIGRNLKKTPAKNTKSPKLDDELPSSPLPLSNDQKEVNDEVKSTPKEKRSPVLLSPSGKVLDNKGEEIDNVVVKISQNDEVDNKSNNNSVIKPKNTKRKSTAKSKDADKSTDKIPEKPVDKPQKKSSKSRARTKKIEEEVEEEDGEELDDISVDVSLPGDNSKPSIMFSMIDEKTKKGFSKDIVNLGGKIVDSSKKATYLICDEVKRSKKIIECILLGKKIVTTQWLRDSIRDSQWKLEEGYEVHDKIAENEYTFSLQKSLEIARNNCKSKPLFQGHCFYITANCTPPKDFLSDIILLGGGQIISELPIVPSTKYHTIILASDIDRKTLIKNWRSTGFTNIHTGELILMAVLQQHLNLESCLVK